MAAEKRTREEDRPAAVVDRDSRGAELRNTLGLGSTTYFRRREKYGRCAERERGLGVVGRLFRSTFVDVYRSKVESYRAATGEKKLDRVPEAREERDYTPEPCVLRRESA